MAGYKIGLLDQVSRLDGLLPETQVGHGNAAGLLGIIIKVSLCVHVCIVTDNLDGVLVGANGTVCAKAPELAVNGAFRRGDRIFLYLQGKVGNVIINTDGESFFFCIVVYGDNLARRSILGAQAITAAGNLNCVELGALQCSHNIQV